MTPIEVWEECGKIGKEIGPLAEVDAFVTRFRRGVWLAIKPRPYPSQQQFSTNAHDTWEEAFADARKLWAEQNDTYAADMIRDISLAIVRLTYDNGECADAALRAEFDVADIATYGSQAIERANAMAEGAPFKIVETAGANNKAA